MREMLLCNRDLLLKLEAMERKLTGHDEKIAARFR